MHQLSNRNGKHSDEGLAESCEDLIEYLATQRRAIEGVGRQRDEEPHCCVKGGISAALVWNSLDVLDGRSVGSYETLDVELNKSFLDWQDSRRCQVSQTQNQHVDAEVSGFDHTSKIYVVCLERVGWIFVV